MSGHTPGPWVLVPRKPTPEMVCAGFLSKPDDSGILVDGPMDAPSLVWRAMLDAAPQPPAEAQPVGDVGEFGVGIQPNPKARYWQERAEFWKAQAVALGWREKRDAANGETPPSAPVGVEGLVERMRQAPSRLWMADLVGQKISVERMRDILTFALAQQPAAVDGVEQLTEQQAVIVTGYTGVLCGSFDAFHADLEKRAGHSVWTHEMADSGWIKPLYRDDFIALTGQQGGES